MRTAVLAGVLIAASCVRQDPEFAETILSEDFDGTDPYQSGWECMVFMSGSSPRPCDPSAPMRSWLPSCSGTCFAVGGDDGARPVSDVALVTPTITYEGVGYLRFVHATDLTMSPSACSGCSGAGGLIEQEVDGGWTTVVSEDSPYELRVGRESAGGLPPDTDVFASVDPMRRQAMFRVESGPGPVSTRFRFRFINAFDPPNGGSPLSNNQKWELDDIEFVAAEREPL